MKVRFPDLATAEMLTDPYVPLPDVSDNFQRALATLIAYDKSTPTFRFVRVTPAGSLQVTKANPDIASPRRLSLTVNSSVQVAAARNNSRVKFMVHNTGITAIKVSMSDNPTTSLYVTINPGAWLIEENYTGEIRYTRVGGDGTATFYEFATQF